MGVFDFIKDAGSKILGGGRGLDDKLADAKEQVDAAEAAATGSSGGGAAQRAREAASAAKERAEAAAEAAKEKAEAAAEAAKEKAAEAREAASRKRDEARAAFNERRAEAKKADELEDYLNKLGMGDGIDVRFDDGTAYIEGTVPDQETLERVVLAVGNVEGVERVDEDLDVEAPSDAATMYTVQPGDTLSKIAQDHYGDANRYPEIFEANRPMLSDPDKIYPGQTLRIPS